LFRESRHPDHGAGVAGVEYTDPVHASLPITCIPSTQDRALLVIVSSASFVYSAIA
jgi:hypothetical protein